MVDGLIIPKKSSQIDRDFFGRDAETIAYDLLGRTMVRERKGKPPLYVQLTEIAAYEGVNGKNIKEAQKKNPNLFYAPGVMGVSSSHGHYLIDVGTNKFCVPSCITLIGGNLFDKRGFREELNGPGKISAALEIDKSYDSTPIDFGEIWIGGEGVLEDMVKARSKSNAPANWKGNFYITPNA